MLRTFWRAIGTGGPAAPIVRWLNVTLLTFAGITGSVAAYSVYFAAGWSDPNSGDDYCIRGGWFSVIQHHEATPGEDWQSLMGEGELNTSRAIVGAVSNIHSARIKPWHSGWRFHRSVTDHFPGLPFGRWGHVYWTSSHRYSLQWLCLALAALPLATAFLNAGSRLIQLRQTQGQVAIEP